jgi:N-acylneuraminate cytidylyltransferase
MRPLNLADDFTHAHVAARHALEWALREWGPIHAFCHLYSTAPFLTADHIKEGVKHINAGATNVYAMQRIGFPIY